jgi:15-cis-phytoene desaturase
MLYLKKNVIIVGSGLAGMSAAANLVKAGHQVTILERNNYLGGRTSSWIQDGMHVESGLHRYLGFYYYLPKLLNNVGISVDDIIDWEDAVVIRSIEHPAVEFSVSPLHRPLHTLGNAFSNYNFISFKERLKLINMLRFGIKLYRSNPYYLDEMTVIDLASKFKLKRDTIRQVLVPFTEGIFFLPIEQYSAYAFLGLIMPYKKRLPFMRAGAFNGPMSDVLIDPIANYITKRGGSIIQESPVEEIIIKEKRVAGVRVSNNNEYYADAVVLATSLGPAQRIIRQSNLNHDNFSAMLAMPTMPAVTMQFELTEPALAKDITTFGPGTSMASFSEQSRTTFKHTKGRLSVIMAQPSKHISMNDHELADIVYKDAFKLGLNINPSTVVSYRKITEPDDFYRLGINSEIMRPTQITNTPGLLLAGDYTKQQYLATMEGAVYSGLIAASHIVRN